MDNLSAEDKEFLQNLSSCNQQKVIDSLTTTEQITNFVSDVKYFDAFYPGGLKAYIEKAKILLEKSSQRDNPMAGWKASVPDTVNIEFNTISFHKMEADGIEELMKSGFVLVAGGLGERLGFNGIKVSLPTETFSMLSFLGYYIKKILAIQHRIPKEQKRILPFAIMTSDNNHELTMEYLENNHYFGMESNQVFVMKQDVIPAIINLSCELAVDTNGYLIKKPHGHGDVHFCLYRDGIADKWYHEFGIRKLFFFQDTNALSFYTMPCTASICEKQNAHMISTCVKRRPHEASGAVCKLTRDDGDSMVCNVEYNQLEYVIKTTDPRGDYADDSGYSPYPGNTNILCFNLEDYLKVLNKSHGIVPEFVNPKYKAGSNTEYQQPTRLESMMQDYPKLIHEYRDCIDISTQHIAVIYPHMMAWSPVKNGWERAKELEQKMGNAASAASGEIELMKNYRNILYSVNECPICNPNKQQRIEMDDTVHIVLDAETGCTVEEVHQHLGCNIVLKAGSVLIIQCRNWFISDFTLDGCCIISSNNDESETVIQNVNVKNDGWSYRVIDHNDEDYDIVFRMRGFVVEKRQQCEFVTSSAGKHSFHDTTYESIQYITE